MALMLAKKELEGGDYAVRVCTKEATDIQMDPEQYPDQVFAKEDILPYLTVTYAKKNGHTGVSLINVDTADCPVEIYNINGIKLNNNNLTPGIYVKKQGAVITKFIVK